MALRSAQLEALYVRRREQEFERVQRTTAQTRYYDHWKKQNSRYENWTAPEYYSKAEEQMKQKRERTEKEAQLIERRDKLRQLLSAERIAFEREAEERRRPRSRRVQANNETLSKIDEQIKEREKIRRKLELEAKLYGRMRHGVEDDNAIFQSKTDNEVLAKLNWLDKQIEEQMQREKDEAEQKDRELRMQQELVKYEEMQRERQKIREREICEVRALQERHMNELNQHQQESELLKSEEQHLRLCQEELEKEMELLEESAVLAADPVENSQAYNLKKIKVFIRKRSEMFRGQIRLAMGILERLRAFALRTDDVNALYKKYKEQLDVESHTVTQIEAMYESEAKYNMQRCEEAWQAQQTERYHEMKQLLLQVQSSFQTQLNDNLQRQSELIELRTTHLTAIENSNEKLKQLVKEQEDSPRNCPAQIALHCDKADTMKPLASNMGLEPPTAANSPRPSAGGYPQTSPRPSSHKLSNSFANLNLDAWQGEKALPGGGIDSPHMETARSVNVVTPNNVERSRFARKRVAWT